MPAIIRKGTDLSTGHGCYPPVLPSQGSPNVKVNGKSVVRQSDSYDVHCKQCGKKRPCHRGAARSSSTVRVNGKPIQRAGDSITCGDTAAHGSSNVRAN